MSPKGRFEFVVNKKLCFICFSPKHRAQLCKRIPTCQVPGCSRKHSNLLHFDDVGSANISCSESKDYKVVGETSNSMNQMVHEITSNACGSVVESVYVPLVPVTVNGKVYTWALLDSGSTNSFISDKLANELNLQGSCVRYHLSTLGASRDIKSKTVDVCITSTEGQTIYLKNVMVVPNIPATFPKQPIDITQYPHLQSLPLPHPTANAQAQVLIGMDNAHLIMPLEIRSGSKLEPYATHTALGWSLCGPICQKPGQSVFSFCVSVDQQINKLWNMEAHEDNESLIMSQEDKAVLELWDKEIQYENGHYVLPIPWKGGQPSLPNNRFMAVNRLNSLAHRLHKSNTMKIYSDNIKKLLTEGNAEEVPPDELKLTNGSVWYLPHHPVISERKPDKVRIVFDCSAKFNKVSLNSECLQGPDLNNKLLHVLLCFREYEFAVMADVQAMYHQVKIPNKDKNALRFLWLEGNNIKEYRMNSHLFGGVWCASSSTYALRKSVLDFPCSNLIQQTVRKNMYVDDMLKSVPTVSEVIEVIVDTKRVLSCGRFNLTKFVTNNKDLLKYVNEEDRAAEVKEIKPDVHCKALGIKLDVNQDEFYYVNKLSDFQGNVTKRHILSQLSSMYDPLGLISLVVHPCKVLFQQTTRLKLDWDAPVPSELAHKWLNCLKSLRFISELRFPRCICPKGFVSGAMEIHNFADASEVGYGAYSYLRVINPDGKIHVTLLASKSRLAPIKQISIPRLELCAMVLAVQLNSTICQELNLEIINSTFWSDSQIAIAYVQNESKRFKTFVGNRVATILRHSDPNQWRYVNSDQNPADVLSRGCCAQSVPQSWVCGPRFLGECKNTWPPNVSVTADWLNTNVEVKKEVFTVTVNATESLEHPMEMLIEHYSSFYRLKKALCWIMRWKEFLKKTKPQTELSECITAPELMSAEKQIIQYIQRQYFHSEIVSITSQGVVSASSSLRKLNPILDADGLLVIGGRLKHARMPYESRYPVILPSSHKVSFLIAKECHGIAHSGIEWSLSQLRRKYWIVHARSLLKKVKHGCTTCKKLYAPTQNQRMADLPPERGKAGLPCFSYVGVDLFGPFYVKLGRSEVKRYGCLYTCFTTRAIPLKF